MLMKVLGRTKKSEWIMQPMGKAAPLTFQEQLEALKVFHAVAENDNEGEGVYGENRLRTKSR